MRILKKLCVTALLVLPVAAFANPTGIWAGTVTKGNQTVSLRATFTQTSVDIHFTGTANCQTKARPEKADGRVLTYRFGVSTNGGKFCDDITDKIAELGYEDGNDEMSISFDAWRGTLGKQN